MADVRINALATTATTSASDDYLAIDGSANGTRKLSAFSPTFGGNLTVSGTGTFGGTSTLTGGYWKTKPTADDGTLTGLSLANSSGAQVGVVDVNTLTGDIRVGGTNSAYPLALYSKSVAVMTFGASSAATLAGNLTVSGGTVNINVVGTQQILNWQSSGSTIASATSISSTGEFRLNMGPGAGWGGYMTWQTDTTERMRLTNSGNFLVGTTTDNSATFAVNRGGVAPASSGSTSTAAIRAVDVSNDVALDIGVNAASSPYPGWIQVHGRTNQATNYPLTLNPNGGNVLVGTTTDNGAKFQVEGYATFNRNGADGYLSVSRTSGATGTFGAGSTNSYLGTATNHPLVLYTNGTTALTLDSSQNATFAGTIKPQQAATASAPSYVKGAIYFDTTLNKLRVGGATGWETITSI